MKSLLLNPNDWRDSAGNTPPAIYYPFAAAGGNYGFTADDTLTFIGTADPGDAILFSIQGGSGTITITDGDGQITSIDVSVSQQVAYRFPTYNPSLLTLRVTNNAALGIRANPASLLQFTPQIEQGASADTANCDCTDTTGNKTLATLRADLMVRLGFAAQKNNPPPGMTDLLNSFLIEAQELLYRRYDVLRTLRFYSWNLQAGVKFYDINANVETCTKRLDPRKVNWVGVQVQGVWYPLECGIPPPLYSQNPGGRPLRYEIRQCIEVWPVPATTEGTLVIKGDFGLEPFAADTDTTTIDDRLVFLLALANAKAHYGKPDANNYIAQMEQMMVNLVAGAHNTRRYIPGRPREFDMVYTAPAPTVPFT